jgi:hypothetical protein
MAAAPGTVRRVQRRELPAPEVRIDGAIEPASTQLGYAGAYSLTLSTTLPTLGLELHSNYLGHEHTATLAGHLTLAPDRRRVRHLLHPPGELPVAGAAGDQPGAHGRGALLLDHLAELRTQLSEITDAEDVRVDVDDAALRALERD